MKRFIFGFVLITVFLGVIYGSGKILYAPSYKIRFNTNGGSVVDTILVRENEKLDKLPVTTKNNYEFVGWFNGDEVFNLDVVIDKDYTLEARWVKKESEKFTIKFDSLGGSKIDDIKLVKGSHLDNLEEPVKEGYKFVSWVYQNKDVLDIIVDKDMILVAKWEKIED